MENKRIIATAKLGKTIGEEALIDVKYEGRTETCAAAEDSAVMGIPVELILKLQLGIDKLISRTNAEKFVTHFCLEYWNN